MGNLPAIYWRVSSFSMFSHLFHQQEEKWVKLENMQSTKTLNFCATPKGWLTPKRWLTPVESNFFNLILKFLTLNIFLKFLLEHSIWSMQSLVIPNYQSPRKMMFPQGVNQHLVVYQCLGSSF